MRRRLHLILAALTVLLLAVLFASGRWAGQVSLGGEPYVFASVYEGCIGLGLISGSPYAQPTPVRLFFCDFAGTYGVSYRLRWLPRYSNRERSGLGGGYRGVSLSVPLWMGALASGAPAAILWRRHRRQRRRERLGKCPFCGYDLAGIQPAADGKIRCPECGARLRPKGESP